MTECEGYLGREELCLILLEALNLDEVAEKFASLDKVHEEIDTHIVLEDVLHID
jgi:hypothetical protein